MRVGLLLPCALVIAAAKVDGQLGPLVDQQSAGGLYGSIGVGAISLQERSGLTVPLSLTLLSTRLKIVATVTAFDFALLQERDRTPRYRLVLDSFGRQFCVDAEQGFVVSSSRCSGDVNIVRSHNVDLGIMPTEALLVAGEPGRLYLGIGFRARKPTTPYGMIGMFFDSPSGRSGGVRLAMGSDYLTIGFSWGIDVRRLRRRSG